MIAELLELLHDADTRWTTIRATVRSWQDYELLETAWEVEIESQDNSVTMIGFSVASDDPVEVPAEQISRIWLRPPASRCETDGPYGSLTASDGSTVRTRLSTGLMEHAGDRDEGLGIQLEWLFWPAALLGVFEPDEIAETEALGRPALRARGRLRHRAWPPVVQPGADELELVVDRERGVVLRTESFHRGAPLSVNEVTEIAFDEDLADELFRLEPEEGEMVERPDESMEEFVLHTTVEDAAGRASFTVWVPSVLERPADDPSWARWDMHHVSYGAKREGVFPMEEHVSIHIPFGEGGLTLAETVAAEPIEPGDGWERIERDGRTVYVSEGKGLFPPSALIDLEGTRVQITGSRQTAPETLAEIGLGLVRADPQPPSIGG